MGKNNKKGGNNKKKKGGNKKKNNNKNTKPKNETTAEETTATDNAETVTEEPKTENKVEVETAAATGEEEESKPAAEGGEEGEEEPKSQPEPEDEPPAATGEVTEEKKEEATEPEPEPEAEPEEPPLPANLGASLSLFTERQQELVRALCSSEVGQRHLFERWPAPSQYKSPSSESIDNVKRRLVSQLESLDDSYPDGGLVGYVTNAKRLLADSRAGVNPLDGWTPSVPQGEAFDVGTEAFDETEQSGLKEVGKCGFVLVAGGLGERLGYGDIKIGLPTELATETSYLQFYIETILAHQSQYAEDGAKLPLCIMTSGDTNEKTVALLKKHNNFGMDEDQITIVQQGDGVPALEDNNARIALDPTDRYCVSTKPHGHGDIHALLHSHGVAKGWAEKGMKWAIFFQDTNGLAFHSLPLSLGVSSKLGLIMNSITVPRKAKQAIGAIAKLRHENGDVKTVNVEYNQLDPLLKASADFPDGDVNDEETGNSPFPGNINQLVFELGPYVETLEATKGVMPEFVNPKYKDAEKTVFKKPTRLECMMQDFPTVLSGDASSRVGFTSLPAELCFSPVKNAVADGVALQAKGTAAGVAATGEADQYGALRRVLRSIGCAVEDASPRTFAGVEIVPGPEIMFRADFAACPAEIRTRFTKPDQVTIAAGSSLVVKGSGATIESLQLDGALVVECEEGGEGVVRDLVVKNRGWEKEPVADDEKDEILRMRGYRLRKNATHHVLIKKDGTMETRDIGDATATEEEETEPPAAEPETKPAAQASPEVAATEEKPAAVKAAPEPAAKKSEATPQKKESKPATAKHEIAPSNQSRELDLPIDEMKKADLNECCVIL